MNDQKKRSSTVLISFLIALQEGDTKKEMVWQHTGRYKKLFNKRIRGWRKRVNVYYYFKNTYLKLILYT